MPEKEDDRSSSAEEKSKLRNVRLVDKDRVQIEFRIDDLMKLLEIDKMGPVEACSGCDSCS